MSARQPCGTRLGPFEAMWESERTTIEEGQSLVVYTDGLTELRDAQRAECGTERLAELVCQEFNDAEAIAEVENTGPTFVGARALTQPQVDADDEGGRGLIAVRALADEVTVHFRDGRCVVRAVVPLA